MPADESAPMQIFKDANFNNSDTSKQNYTANQIRENITNNYTGSPEVMGALRDAIRLLKAEVWSLKEENKRLQEELKGRK